MPSIKVEPTIPNYPPQGIQAQLDLLYLWNPDVANGLIDQINKALEDLDKDLTMYLTKTEAAATYATQTEVTQLSGALEEVSNKVNTVDNDLKELGDQTANIQQDVNTLKTDVAGKASKDANFKTAITDTNKGLTEADAYTKEEVDAKVSSVYRFRGSVAIYNDLPTEGNVQGDVWNVEDTGANYAWDGTKWDKLSETIDLTPYLTKEDAASTYATITTVNGKQDALTPGQMAAVDSGITAEHVASYDAYAGEISAAQSTADKADNAAEVAQQTANLAGQEAAQALSGLAGKVNINQGADNAGKVMTVGEDGNLTPTVVETKDIVWDKTYDWVNATDYAAVGLKISLGDLQTGTYDFCFMIKNPSSYAGVSLEVGIWHVHIYYNKEQQIADGRLTPLFNKETSYEVAFKTAQQPSCLNVSLIDNSLVMTGDSSPFWVNAPQGTYNDTFAVTKIKNAGTGEEFSAAGLGIWLPEETMSPFASFPVSYVDIGQLVENGSNLYNSYFPHGVMLDGFEWRAPSDEPFYPQPNFFHGQILVSLAVTDQNGLATGDTCVLLLTCGYNDISFKRLYATGKLANVTPFLEETANYVGSRRPTFRNPDKSDLISDTEYLTGQAAFYGIPRDGGGATMSFSDLQFVENQTLEPYQIPEETNTSLPDQTGNAGKFLTTDGTNASWGEAQPAAITTDATLTGAGTADSPLGIAQSVQESIDGKVSKSGDTMTGPLTLVDGTAGTQGYSIEVDGDGINSVMSVWFDYNRSWGYVFNGSAFYPNFNSNTFLGLPGKRWATVYTLKINNGADITIPTTGGTMALLSDIPSTEVSSGVFTENLGNNIVRISGTESFGVLAQQGTAEHPITLPVTLADANYVVQTTATSANGMCEIVSDFSARTATGFTIGVRNLTTAAEATDVAVCWSIIGQKA